MLFNHIFTDLSEPSPNSCKQQQQLGPCYKEQRPGLNISWNNVTMSISERTSGEIEYVQVKYDYLQIKYHS